MAKRKKKVDLATIKNIVVVSDLHCGCRLGLCPDWGANLDDGGAYLPSRLQNVVWAWWEEFWNEWVPKATRNEPYAVVVNGDVIDGVHHRATTQISHNLEDQCNIAHEVLVPVVERCEGRFFMVRGTPAHTGEQGVQEERLAKWLGAIPNEDGQHARYELWKTFGDGKLVHFNHHIGTTSSSAHETSAINAELATAFVEAGRWGKTPPNVVVRSHRHRCAEVRIPSNDGYSISVVTPAWQLKTPFAFKVAGARQTMPQIGGILVRQGDEELHTRFFVKSIERPAAT
jgi:hypothetical protein